MGLEATKKMLEKLADKKPDTNGYVTTIPEIIAILSELSKLVPAGVLIERESDTDISVLFKIGFTIEKDLDSL